MFLPICFSNRFRRFLLCERTQLMSIRSAAKPAESRKSHPPSGRRGDYVLKVLYDRMVRDVEILVLREYHRATVFETPADKSCPRVFAATRGDKVFVTMQ